MKYYTKKSIINRNITPIEIPWRCIIPLSFTGLNPATSLQGEIFILHGSHVPTFWILIKLHLEGFVIGYFFLVCRDIYAYKRWIQKLLMNMMIYRQIIWFIIINRNGFYPDDLFVPTFHYKCGNGSIFDTAHDTEQFLILLFKGMVRLMWMTNIIGDICN